MILPAGVGVSPFLFSLVLLAISLWVRLMLRESPVFRAMQIEGKIAHNPLKESVDSWPKWRKLLVVLFGITAGLTVIFYTAHFQSLYFIQNAVRIDDTPARLIVGFSAFLSIGWYVLFGWLSDKIGRRPPIIAGYVLMLLLAFPLFKMMQAEGNPDLVAAMARAPVIVRGSDCTFNPLATHGQSSACGKVLDSLSKRGITYKKVQVATGAPAVTVGSKVLLATDDATIEKALADAGYPTGKVSPPRPNAWKVAFAIIANRLHLGHDLRAGRGVAGRTVPGAGALQPRSPSPTTSGRAISAASCPSSTSTSSPRRGDPLAGLWYTVGVTAMALLIVSLAVPETSGKELE